MRLHLFSKGCFGFGALALGFAAGCGNSGGQTGDLSGQNGGGGPAIGEYGGCEEHQEPLKDFDEETEAGTAEALMAYAEKTFDAPLSWKTAVESQAWSVGPETGEGRLHLTVTRGDKAYRLTYSARKSDNGLETGGISSCPPPSLGVDAHVDVTTDGGALAESFDALLRTHDAGVASLSVPLDLNELGGSLRATSSNPHAKLVQASIEAVLTAAGSTGSLTAMEQTTSGDVAGASRALLAVWPGSAACADAKDGVGLEVSLSDDVLGTNGNEALASVALAAPTPITWMDDSTTKLSVTIASAGNGCFSVKSEWPPEWDSGPGASYPVLITLKSDDGRVDGQYEGHAVVSGMGSEQRVQVAADVEVDAAHFADSGFSGVGIPPASQRVRVSVKVNRQGAMASGSVDLFASATSPCVAEPPMSTPGGGASAPGCAGESMTRIENASWDY